MTLNISGSAQLSGNLDLSNKPIVANNRLIYNMVHWQVSDKKNFSNLVFESIDDRNNLTSITLPNLICDTTYYWRVRYHDTTKGYTGWSKIINFKKDRCSSNKLDLKVMRNR